MISSSFLIAALALKPNPMANYRELVKFIHQYMPNCEVVLVHDEHHLAEWLGYEKTPFRWGLSDVYVRRDA